MTFRRGFVLLSVLWFVTGAATLALGTTLHSRNASNASFNRVALTRAEWLADACLEAVLWGARTELARSGQDVDSIGRVWNALDEVTLRAPIVTSCPGEVRMTATERTVDLNTASDSLLRAVLVGLQAPAGDVAPMVAALLDWRDPDHEPRPGGAERDWYRAQELRDPRNGPLRSIAELRAVRGFAVIFAHGASRDGAALEERLTVDPLPGSWIVRATAAGDTGADGAHRLLVSVETRLVRGGASVFMTRRQVEP